MGMNDPLNEGTPNHKAILVLASNTVVLPENKERSFLYLINDSAAVIYVTLDGTVAALNKGIRLNTNGGAIQCDVFVPNGPVKAYCVTPNSRLLVTEY